MCICFLAEVKNQFASQKKTQDEQSPWDLSSNSPSLGSQAIRTAFSARRHLLVSSIWCGDLALLPNVTGVRTRPRYSSRVGKPKDTLVHSKPMTLVPGGGCHYIGWNF